MIRSLLSFLGKADFSADERRHLAESGAAMPDGSFPIRNAVDLHNAMQAIGRAKDPEAVKRHIRRRARELGLSELLTDAFKSQAKRRIKYAKVTHVSLVSRGANKMPVLLKSGGRVEFNMLFKSASEEGLLHALVYVPEENGAVDTEGDVAPRTVVKQMAHDFIANGAHLDVEHDMNVLSPEQASVAETFLVQKGDPRFQGWMDNYGAAVDATDAWGMVIKVSDPALQKAVKDGRIAGVSLFGLAEVEPIAKSTSILDNMTEAELKALFAAQSASIVEAITKALKPAPVTPAPTEPAPVAPVAKTEIKFEGDPLDLKALAAHKEKLFLASLDLSKAEDVAKAEAYVAAKNAKPAPGKPAPSNQPAGEPEVVPVEKTETDLFKAGKGLGAKINKVAGR